MLGRLVRVAPLVGATSLARHTVASCYTENHLGQAVDNLEILELLMANKATVHPGLASSIVAHHSGDDPRVRTLVDRAIARGADADEALRFAYHRGDQAMISHLLVGRTTVPQDSIRWMVQGACRRRWGSLVEKGPLFARIREAAALGSDPSASNWRGVDAAIVDAVTMGDVELVRLLLELGADPAAVDYRDRSALWLAIDKKHPMIVRMLLDASTV
jgi:hypothetical protein